MKTRLSDSSSVYIEERYQNSDWSSGLTHATGINLAPTERLNFGASTDFGTLRDTLTGAETERRAAASASATGSTRCSSRAASSTAPTRPSSPT